MKEIIAWVIGILSFIVLLIFLNRPLMIFGEETRRLVFQTSQTAKSACRKELLGLYTEWSKATGPHKTALALEAREESRRNACRDLPIEVQYWIEEIE